MFEKRQHDHRLLTLLLMYYLPNLLPKFLKKKSRNLSTINNAQAGPLFPSHLFDETSFPKLKLGN